MAKKKYLSGYQKRQRRKQLGQWTDLDEAKEKLRLRKNDEARRRRVADFVSEYKLSRGCADCGYNRHFAALEFDHLPGFVKSATLAHLRWSCVMSKILAEMEKCEVVCANCHAIRTYERRRNAATTVQA